MNAGLAESHDPLPIALPDEGVRPGAVLECNTLERDYDDACDYVVVGSGAAGAVAAHTLAESGAEVILVEEGPWIKTREFGESVYGAFQTIFRDSGTQAIEGRSMIPVLQGRCVGGTTVVNSAIMHRLPEDVLVDWGTRFGLGAALSARRLDEHFEAIERDLRPRSVPDDVLGENSRLFLTQARARGMSARSMHRFEQGCRGSARCLTGCPTGAKQAMNVTFIPWALARGVRLLTSCRVERVVLENGVAKGVVARSSDAAGRHASRIRVHARRAVVLAASTVQTPNLLRRSGVRARALGRHFQCHPGYAIAGRFDAPVDMMFGATQGGESVEGLRRERIKLETLSMPPELAALRVPGVGQEFARRLADFANVAVWAVVVRAEAEGRVCTALNGRDAIRWTPTQQDVERARRGAALLARMMFDAGAREVWPGLFGVPSVIRRVDDVALIDRVSPDPRLFGFIATHLFGTCRMGVDPRTSVVGPDFQVHGVRGLYVTDSSVFPTNLGVNPQHSIMALSRLAATHMAERFSR